MEANIKAYVAELIGTFVLTLFGCGTAVIVGCDVWGGYLATAIAFGLSVMVMSVTIGNISGCHINPAISLAMFLDKKLSAKDLVGYIIFQIIGAIIAGAVLGVFLMGYHDMSFADVMKNCSFGSNGLDGVSGSIMVGLVVEIVLTFVFLLVVFGATSKKGMDKFGGFFIGLGLIMVHLVGIGLTGTSVNPARSIGVAIFQSGALSDLWIFIVAPFIGAIIAWAVWHFVLAPADEYDAAPAEE